MAKLHLAIVGQAHVSVGRFGCDYHSPVDAAYYCLPHRWEPGSDQSYALYQSGFYAEMDDHEADQQNQDPRVVRAARAEAAAYEAELKAASKAKLEASGEDDIPF